MTRYAIAALVAFGTAFTGTTHPALAFQLITAAEAQLPPAQVTQVSTRGLTRGPTVDQVSPPPDAAAPNSPINLDITFAAHNGATIDPAKVKVTYLKQPAIDLTGRLKPFITPKGIEASDVDVPPGTHLIKIEVTDSDGRSTTNVMTIQVAAK
jgi:hypothetical protein